MKRALLLLLLSVVASGQQYVMSTFAGGLPPATPAEAAAVSVGDPPRVAVDAAGNIYFGSLHAIFKVDRSGSLTRIAGTGHAGLTGDGGPATTAQLNYPVGIAVDATGAIFYTERDSNFIRRIAPEGAIATLPVADLSSPMGLAFDLAGNLYVADTGANAIRKIAANGSMTTVAGNGTAGFSGDDGPALSASLNGPEGVAVDAAGNVYIADTFNHRIRIVTTGGKISTLAGNGFPGYAGEGGDPASASMFLPTDVAVDSGGNIYIADLGNSLIRKVSKGVIVTIAGNSGGLPPREGLSATAVRLSGPTGVAVDANGAVYIAEGSIGSGSGLDGGDFRIWQVASGRIAPAAGTGLKSFSGDGGPAATAQFDAPGGIARDARGNLFIADTQNNRIRKIAPDGVVTTVAGNALAGFAGDGGPATLAELNRPTDVAVDADGNLFIADSGNNRVRKVFPNGVIGTLAGNGNLAYFGDGGNSAQAALNHPRGVAVDASGTVYIADTGNHRIRRVIFAGIDTVLDGLNAPTGVAVDNDGVVYVADSGDGTVRRFQNRFSQVTLLAGARGVTVDSFGNVYASGSNRVVKVLGDGSTMTIAGTGQCCYAGDGGPAAAARLNAPWGIAVDPSGNLYIADTGNDAIRMATVTASTFFIRAIANGASNLVSSVAPGEIVTIYGAGLGPSTLAVGEPAGGVLPTTVGGTAVLFNGTAAPLLYASAGQVSAIVPYSVGGATVQVVVQSANVSTQPFPLAVAASSPGLFTTDSTGTGAVRALNADGASNSASRPALAGSTLTLFATGEGQTSPAGVDGRIAGAVIPEPVLPVRVTIGGKPAEVQSAGAVTGAAGVMQVVVTVPAGITGVMPIMMTVGGASSQPGVTVAVQ
jgi:uncharacterized protein (TIGR03437 family)